MKKLAIALLIMAALVWGAWVAAIPADVIEKAAEESLSQGGLEADLTGFKKGLFYSVSSEALDVTASGARLLSVEGLTGRLDVPSSVRNRKAVIMFRGTLAGGELDGSLRADRKGRELDASLTGARLEELGLYEHAGLRASGSLSADLHMRGNEGEATFSVTEAELGTVRQGGFDVPLSMFHTVRGALKLNRNSLVVNSVTMEGQGIYARASGVLRGGVLDAKLELMPEKGAAPEALVSALLERYRSSPGHYVIPVRRSLRF